MKPSYYLTAAVVLFALTLGDGLSMRVFGGVVAAVWIIMLAEHWFSQHSIHGR